MSDFHNAVVNVASSFVVIPVVAGLVTFIVSLFLPMIPIAKFGCILGIIGFATLVYILREEDYEN